MAVRGHPVNGVGRHLEPCMAGHIFVI